MFVYVCAFVKKDAAHNTRARAHTHTYRHIIYYTHTHTDVYRVVAGKSGLQLVLYSPYIGVPIAHISS